MRFLKCLTVSSALLVLMLTIHAAVQAQTQISDRFANVNGVNALEDKLSRKD